MYTLLREVWIALLFIMLYCMYLQYVVDKLSIVYPYLSIITFD